MFYTKDDARLIESRFDFVEARLNALREQYWKLDDRYLQLLKHLNLQEEQIKAGTKLVSTK